MTTTCTYHCRSCGAHLRSLEAFDAHREGPPGSERACSFPKLPEDHRWVEITGTCTIGGEARMGVAIYSLVRPGKYIAESRETAEGSVKQAV
jgi:hypothetical protein